MIRWVFHFAAKSVGMHKGRDGDRCEGGGQKALLDYYTD